MSAAGTLPTTAAPKRRIFTGRVTQGHVLRSEWTKLWSLRSTRWSLLFAVVAMAGLGVLIAAVSMGRWSHLSPHDRATFDSIDRSLGGYHLAQLAIGVLGVLVISGEYSTGMIRSTLIAVPEPLAARRHSNRSSDTRQEIVTRPSSCAVSSTWPIGKSG